ncbi:uncharacterized protein LOC112572069 [Pomacea canaliculata]|uniref:uncharacterized protein LOC112572069 n=1 Tax=Pomacea canaliculata TaxID=400727 RepID=UPI000D73EE13|nr:uncharacterized protein LOC112572069 [Pomacea canaliculata]
MSLPSSFLLLVGAVFIHIVLAQESVVTRCSRDPAAVFAHPDNCHQYFNCSADSNRVYPAGLVGPDSHNFYLSECPYPQYFNEVTLQCDDYHRVQCGDKFKPVDQCEYTRYTCIRSHCMPCYLRSPSCKGLQDGANVFTHREWSPFFIVCEDQRLVNTSTCPPHQELQMNQLFSPNLGRCASLYEIPKEHGGLFFDCSGRPDGLYPDDVTNKVNLLFRCLSGVLVEILV